MNNRAIIFQRNSVGSTADREAELARLEHCKAIEALTVVPRYVASGEPNLLTIELLIDNSLAVLRAWHITHLSGAERVVTGWLRGQDLNL